MEKPIVSKKGNTFSICAIIAFNFIFKILIGILVLKMLTKLK